MQKILEHMFKSCKLLLCLIFFISNHAKSNTLEWNLKSLYGITQFQNAIEQL